AGTGDDRNGDRTCEQGQSSRGPRDPGPLPLTPSIGCDDRDGQQHAEQRLGKEDALCCQRWDRDTRGKYDRSGDPTRNPRAEQLSLGGMPGDQSGRSSTQEGVENLAGDGADGTDNAPKNGASTTG